MKTMKVFWNWSSVIIMCSNQCNVVIIIVRLILYGNLSGTSGPPGFRTPSHDQTTRRNEKKNIRLIGPSRPSACRRRVRSDSVREALMVPRQSCSGSLETLSRTSFLPNRPSTHSQRWSHFYGNEEDEWKQGGGQTTGRRPERVCYRI